ncbi:MAG TPA: hypothetical protein VG937_26315 [Polyangiaceae bacterium]|nr:hypothetical protein [Polyangiaceae bacterium]
MNAEWHAQHVLPKNAKLPARIAWHRAHQKHCACRPIPAKVAAAIQERARKSPDSPSLPAPFARIVSAFRREPDVSYGGKGFGSSALKHNGKIFAMLTSKQKFVVRLAKDRVSELVKAKQGRYFDPGHGRLMKEWLELPDESSRWRELAKEALAFARK